MKNLITKLVCLYSNALPREHIFCCLVQNKSSTNEIAMNETKTILGLDIGTSSVKCCVVQVQGTQQNYIIKSQGKCPYNSERIKSANFAQIPSSFSEQNVSEIIASIQSALIEAEVSTYKLDLIAVCGQQHGCVLWDHETVLDGDNNLNFNSISDHVDWTDGRCDPQFLKSLPAPDCYADKVSTGYGCATLFWLTRFKQDLVHKFDRAGTIMDFFTTILCGNDQVQMCEQNSHNWGYYDPERRSWTLGVLESSGFPTHFLPTIVPVNQIVGRSTNFLEKYGIESGIPVNVAFGDLQGIMTVAFLNDKDALVLNMGTSAQLCRLEKPGFKPVRKSTSSNPAVDHFPSFTPGQYFTLAAGLNGGNVLRAYVEFLQEIISKLTGLDVNEAEIWEKLNQIYRNTEPSNCQNSNSFQINSTLFGERHEPNKFFSISNIQFKPPKLLDLTAQLCLSLLENIFDMMALTQDDIEQIDKIVCTGNVMSKNGIFQVMLRDILRRRFGGKQIVVEFIEHCDADVGSTLLAYEQLSK